MSKTEISFEEAEKIAKICHDTLSVFIFYKDKVKFIDFSDVREDFRNEFIESVRFYYDYYTDDMDEDVGDGYYGLEQKVIKEIATGIKTLKETNKIASIYHSIDIVPKFDIDFVPGYIIKGDYIITNYPESFCFLVTETYEYNWYRRLLKFFGFRFKLFKVIHKRDGQFSNPRIYVYKKAEKDNSKISKLFKQ